MPKPSQQTILLTGGIMVALLLLFHKYIFFTFFFLFDDIGSDTMALFYPTLLDDARLFRQDGLSLWSFAKGMGQSSWTNNVLDPMYLVYMLLGQKYIAYGLGWMALIKVAAVSFFSFHTFKFQGLHRNAVILGTILMTFMGYLITGTTWYGHASNIMFMVMFLLGIEWMIARNRWWVLVVAAVCLLGPPLFFISEYALIYGLLRFSLSEKLNINAIIAFSKRLWKPAFAGLLMGAPFLGSIINKFLNSPRLSGDASFASDLSDIGIFSVNEAGHLASILARFFSNDLLGSPNSFTGWKNTLEAPLFYGGLVTLLLVPQLFQFLHKKQRIIFGAVLGFFTLVLVFPWFRNAFYLFQGEYYKGALSFFIPFTLIWMAALAFHHLSSGGKVNIKILGVSLLVLLTTLFSISSISGLIRVHQPTQFTILAFLMIQAGMLFALTRSSSKNIISILICGIAMIEGTIFSFSALNSRSALPIDTFQKRQYYNDYTVEALNYLKSEDPGFYRIEKDYGSFLSNGLNDSQAQGFYDTKTYRSHNHLSYIDFLSGLKLMNPSDESGTRWIGGLRTGDDIHPLINVKYLLTLSGQSNQPDATYFDNVENINGIGIYRSKYFLPLGIPFNQYVVEGEMSPDLDYFRVVELMYNGVVVQDEDVDEFSGMKKYSAQRVSGFISPSRIHNRLNNKCMKITSFNDSNIEGTIDISEPSIVYFSIPFDKGWSAFANGKSVSLSRVNFGMTGLFLEPGQYTIELKYRPPFFFIGILLFILGIAGLIYFSFLRKNKDESHLLPLSQKTYQEEELKAPIKETIAPKSSTPKKSYKKRKKKK